jgi:hypothetical protein
MISTESEGVSLLFRERRTFVKTRRSSDSLWQTPNSPSNHDRSPSVASSAIQAFTERTRVAYANGFSITVSPSRR